MRYVSRTLHAVGDSVSTIYWPQEGSSISLGDSNMVNRWSLRQNHFVELPTQQVNFRRAISKNEYGRYYQLHVVSPSGKLAAATDTVGDIVAWNMQTGQRLFFLDALTSGKDGYSTDICDIAFSPDDHFIAIASLAGDNSVATAPLDISIYDIHTGRTVRQWQWKEASLLKWDDMSGGNLGNTGLTYSSDGSMIAAADDDHAAVWKTANGKICHMMPSVETVYGGKKKLVFFQSSHLLTGCGWGDHVPVWNVDTGQLLQTFYADPDMMAIAVSPAGTLLATGGATTNADGRIELWDVSQLLH